MYHFELDVFNIINFFLPSEPAAAFWSSGIVYWFFGDL